MARLRTQLAAAEAKLAAQSDVTAEKLPRVSEGKNVLAETLAETDVLRPMAVWSYTIQLPIASGYETNPTGLSDELPRRPGLSHKSSAFTSISPNVRFTRKVSDELKWDIAYGLQRTYFHDQADINATGHAFTLSREQKFDNWTLTLSAKDEYRLVDEEGTGNNVQGTITAETKQKNHRQWLAFYSLARQDLRLKDNLPLAPNSSRDSSNISRRSSPWLMAVRIYVARPSCNLPKVVGDFFGFSFLLLS